MVEDILELKTMLLNPKRSDSFTTWVYVDGWRLCDITIGSKKATVKPIAGDKTLSIYVIIGAPPNRLYSSFKEEPSLGFNKHLSIVKERGVSDIYPLYLTV